MSRKKKKMMTPAEVAQQLAAYISKQEETLRRYPVGPLANSARLNMKKGKSALAALQGKNEEMRVGKQPQPVQQMNLGGSASGAVASEFGMTGAQQAMVDSLASEYGMSPAIAAAVASVTQKESGGSGTREEMNYANTSNERIRTLNSRFERKFADMSDEDLNALKADPEKFFNYVYDDVAGNSADGDGYKYRGRGLVQITGKDNYRRVSQAVYGDDRLVDNPDLLLDDKVAGAAAAYFTAESGKGVEGYVDFDLSTPNPTPEQIQEVLNGTYAVVASGGTLPKSTAQDPAKMAEKYGQYSSAMPKMQQFAQQAVPSASASQSTPAPDPSLMNTPDFMLSPEAQQEKAAVLAQNAEAVPPVAQASPQAYQEREGMDLAGLDFNSAKATEAGNNIPGSNITYARNEFGDYNVIVPDKAFGGLKGGYGRVGSSGFQGKYVIRAKDWKGPESIQESLSNAIPYLDDVDGPATDGDRASLFASVFADPTQQNMSLDMDAAMVSMTIGGGQESELQSGMGMSFKEVANLVAEQRGVKPPKKVYNRMAGDMGKSYTTTSVDPQDKKRYDREMDAIYMEIAANPGTFKFTDESGTERVGVGGYSPYSDYVAYNTGDADFQTRFQNRQQTYGLAGQFIAPSAVVAARTAAVSRGSAALGRGLGDDAVAALQAGDEAALNLAVAQETKLLGQGQKMLPQGTGGPAVKGVQGMKFKPGTGAQGQAPTYVPARNAAGRTIDLSPVSKTKTGALTAEQQIRQSGVNVLDDGAGGILGVNRGQFRMPAGSAGGKGGQFGGMQPGGLSLPGSRLPAVRNVGLQTTRQGTTALAPINPMTGLPARTAMQTQTLGLADDAISAIPTIERASGIGGSIFTRTPMALERLGLQAGMTYFPQFDPRQFGSQAPDTSDVTDDVLDDGIDTVPPVKTDPVGGGEEIGGEKVAGLPDETPVKDFDMGEGDKYNIDMGKMSPLMAVPALASLASAGIQRRALNSMEGPARPNLNTIANFDYRSNVGQQLMDAREASRAAGANTNLQGTQQAALAQSLNTQRLQQEARIRQTDEQMRQQALNRYEMMANQVRNTNNAMLNQYAQDQVNFDNAMTQAQAAVKQQPLSVISGAAQDYLKNIYQTNMANTLEGIGRQFDTGAMNAQQAATGGQSQGGMVPIYDAAGNITGYRQQ